MVDDPTGKQQTGGGGVSVDVVEAKDPDMKRHPKLTRHWLTSGGGGEGRRRVRRCRGGPCLLARVAGEKVIADRHVLDVALRVVVRDVHLRLGSQRVLEHRGRQKKGMVGKVAMDNDREKSSGRSKGHTLLRWMLTAAIAG